MSLNDTQKAIAALSTFVSSLAMAVYKTTEDEELREQLRVIGLLTLDMARDFGIEDFPNTESGKKS